jgi:hypothetical protein
MQGSLIRGQGSGAGGQGSGEQDNNRWWLTVGRWMLVEGCRMKGGANEGSGVEERFSNSALFLRNASRGVAFFTSGGEGFK